MNGLLILGVVLNGLLVAGVGMSGEYPAGLTMVMGACWALCLLGVMMVAGGARKAGAIMAVIGCVVFVPLGLVGAFGGRKILDALKQEEFERHRASRS